MFAKKQLTILDWFVFYLLMLIPILNVIVVIVLLISPATNATLRNFLWFWIILILLGFVIGIRFILRFMHNLQNIF